MLSALDFLIKASGLQLPTSTSQIEEIVNVVQQQERDRCRTIVSTVLKHFWEEADDATTAAFFVAAFREIDRQIDAPSEESPDAPA